MDKLSTLAKDFSIENLESYLLDKGFTIDKSQLITFKTLKKNITYQT